MSVPLDTAIGQKLLALANDLRKVKNAGPSKVTDAVSRRRARAIMALNAVTIFLDSVEPFNEENLTDPLWSLQLAVADLESGITTDILRPAKKNGAPVMSSEVQTVMGMSAVAVDMLIKFRNMKPEPAARRVAKALTAAGFRPAQRSNQRPLPAMITDWRHRLETGPGGAPAFAVKQWQCYQTMLQKGVVSVDVDVWITRLTDVARATVSS